MGLYHESVGCYVSLGHHRVLDGPLNKYHWYGLVFDLVQLVDQLLDCHVSEPTSCMVSVGYVKGLNPLV